MEITNITNDTGNTGLLTLVSQMDDYPKTPLKFLQGNNIREVKYNNIYELSDVIKITHLVFYSHLQLEEFKNSIKKCMFEIKINHDVFLKIPLMFLICLNDIVKSNSMNNHELKYYIKFPDFLFEYISVAVICKNLKISCVGVNDQCKYSLLVNLIYLDSPTRKRLAFNKFSKLSQSLIFNSHVTIDENDNAKIFKLIYDRYSKGYFVYGKHVQNIKCFILIENAHTIIKYDKDLIQLFCKKINENTLYVPYNYEKKYYHMNLDSYIGSMNEHKINTTNITIMFDNEVEINNVECEILSLNLEYLNYDRSGMIFHNLRHPLYFITSNYCHEKQFLDPSEDHLLNLTFSDN